MSHPFDHPDSLPPLIDDVVVLTGPTATGKTAVALALVDRLARRGQVAEILSLDSIAVYRDMDIGTAKPSADDRRRAVHHLIDLVDPTEDYSVACYLKTAHEIVADLRSDGKLPIFVGGTPMYLKGILRGFDPGPPADWDFRNSVERDLQTYGVAALYERLCQVDPLAAHNIAPTDSRRMVRALEVAYQTGRPISHRQLQTLQQRSADRCNVFLLQWPRPLLHERINARVDQMFAAGLIDEVHRLLKTYGQLSRTASQAVGYREIIAAIDSGIDLAETTESVAAHTRQMARRQETWFRSLGEIRAINAEELSQSEAIAARIEGMLVNVLSS